MSDGELTEELQKFIAEHVESVEKLEILLLLKRSSDKVWSMPEVYQQIQSSLPSVTQNLGNLEAAGFVKRDSGGNFCYEPTSEKLKTLVANLEKAYRKRRIKVIESIFSQRTEQLRKFANAFRIRKDNI